MAEQPLQCSLDTTAERTPSYACAYRHIRLSIEELVDGRTAAVLPVPAGADRTVRDTVEHLVRTCRLAECNLHSTITRAPVPLDRADLPDLFAEWERSARRVENRLSQTPHARTGSVLIMDAFTHQLDITVALGAPFPARHPALPHAFGMAVEGFSAAVSWRGLPALRIETEQAEWRAGDGVPRASLAGGQLDLYRSLTGRRTASQISALTWSADPAPWLPAFSWGPFTVPETVLERAAAG